MRNHMTILILPFCFICGVSIAIVVVLSHRSPAKERKEQKSEGETRKTWNKKLNFFIPCIIVQSFIFMAKHPECIIMPKSRLREWCIHRRVINSVKESPNDTKNPYVSREVAKISQKEQTDSVFVQK